MNMVKKVSFKVFIVLSLFFPAFYSVFDADYLIEYYAGFSWAYAVLAVFLLCLMLQRKIRGRSRFFWVLLAGIVLYNILFSYYNIHYHHWYGEQVNNTIAFLLVLFLIGSEEDPKEEQDLIRFVIRAAVLSNLCSIVYFALGYSSLLVCNNQVVFGRLPEDFYEYRHYWVYSHKSDYAVMLLGFLGLCIRYKSLFSKKLWYFFSLAVLLTALVLTHSWTGLLGVVLIGIGAVLDRIDFKKIAVTKFHIAGGICLILAAAAAGKLLLAERNLLTLGNRLPIWKGALQTILQYPRGWGFYFGEVLIECGEFAVNNAHNIFLNAILRFSIPVGLCFTLLFLLIFAYALYQCRSWMAAGMCLAVFVLINMDYALQNYEVAMCLLLLYLVCIAPAKSKMKERILP